MAEKYKAELEAHNAEQAEDTKAFDPYELVKKSTEIRVINDPELGEIRFGVITLRDSDEVQPLLEKAKDDLERSRIFLWVAMKKAYPELTLEQVNTFPTNKGFKLRNLVLGSSKDFPMGAFDTG